MRISDWSSDVCSSDLDQQLFVEHDGKRHGPYEPSRGAVPLYRYSKYQKNRAEERIDKVVRLADQLGLPRATVTGGDRPLPSLPASTAGLAERQKPFPETGVEQGYPIGPRHEEPRAG